jgi:hypothetical protein
MKTTDYVALVGAVAVVLAAPDLNTTILLLYLVAVVFALGRTGWSLNIVSMLALIAVFKVAELLLLPVVWQYSNYVIYATWFTLDLLLYFCIIYRAPLMRTLLPPEQAKEVCFTHADLTLGWVHLLHCGASLLSLFEHSLRHLDDFGVPVGWPVVAWLNAHAVVVYYMYMPFQVGLNFVEITAIFATASRYMQSPRFLRA